MAVNYFVYLSNGSLSGTFNSLFAAINASRINGTNSYVMQDDTTEVYRHGINGRYYRYQFTESYGYVTTKYDADSWLTEYDYSHVIDSETARFYGDNWRTGIGSPAPWALELNVGAYYYQFSYVYNGYRSASRTVNLTKARLKPPSGDQHFIAYIFNTVQNASLSVDAGIFASYDRGWNWYLCTNDGVNFQVGDLICTTKQNSSGEYVAAADVTITVGYVDGLLTLRCKNMSTQEVKQLTVSNQHIGGDCAIISAVSFVPDLAGSSPDTPDYRSMGYLITVVNTDSYLYYSSDGSGKGLPFYSLSSATTHFSLLYNTDCAILEPGSSQDTIALYYDRDYTK